MAKTLYICYFGVREPLVQTQVLPYLRELVMSDSESWDAGRDACDPVEVSLLTFEPAEEVVEKGRKGEREEGRRRDREKEFAVIREKLANEGIEWNWLPYHKRPSALATAWDVICGAWFVWRRIGEFDILHGRVHVATLMAAVARKFSRRKPKILFDIRGFFPEEYVDAGIWKEGSTIFRLAKRVERWLMKEADGFVVLTERAREILFGTRNAECGMWNPSDMAGEDDPRSSIRNPQSNGPVEVIPCCVDFARFENADSETRAGMRAKLGIGDRPVLVYVGAFGGWYLTDEMADLFAAFKTFAPDGFAMILTQSDIKQIELKLIANGYSKDDFFIAKVDSSEIPGYLCAADIAVSLIKPCYSKLASSPTKNAEYLACGLPIIANAEIGDVDELILQNGIGTLITEFSRDAYIKAINEIQALGDISERCRETARREFDLETVGGVRYRRLYKKILHRDD
ncbi:MAG: glycosyltransferase [Pyrinomonadaceae bacterium]